MRVGGLKHPLEGRVIRDRESAELIDRLIIHHLDLVVRRYLQGGPTQTVVVSQGGVEGDDVTFACWGDRQQYYSLAHLLETLPQLRSNRLRRRRVALAGRMVPVEPNCIWRLDQDERPCSTSDEVEKESDVVVDHLVGECKRLSFVGLMHRARRSIKQRCYFRPMETEERLGPECVIPCAGHNGREDAQLDQKMARVEGKVRAASTALGPFARGPTGQRREEAGGVLVLKSSPPDPRLQILRRQDGPISVSRR